MKAVETQGKGSVLANEGSGKDSCTQGLTLRLLLEAHCVGSLQYEFVLGGRTAARLQIELPIHLRISLVTCRRVPHFVGADPSHCIPPPCPGVNAVFAQPHWFGSCICP